jgi:hypothetical protein
MLRAKVLFWALVLLMLLYAMATFAGTDTSTDNVVLKGYGTLGAVYHDTPGVQYRRDISQPSSGAKAGQVSFAQDSMLAVQADFRSGSDLSGVVQVVSRLDVENRYTPQVSLANLKYREGASLVRAGRMNIETYLEGDAAEIGYANPMVRQPIIHALRSLDGLAAETTRPLGGGLLRLQGQAGWAVDRLFSGKVLYDSRGAETLNAGVDYSVSAWTGRFSIGQSIFNNQTPALQSGGVFAAILPTLPNGAQLYSKFNMQARKYSNRMLTVGYDKDGMLGQAGYSVYLSPYWPAQRNYYLRGAYRVGDFTPYASYLKRRSERSFVGTGIPDGLSAQTDALNLAISNAEATLFCNQAEFALGMRYDFMRNRALKLQWERIRYQDSQNLIDNRTTNSRAEGREFVSMSLLSVAFEFMF